MTFGAQIWSAAAATLLLALAGAPTAQAQANQVIDPSIETGRDTSSKLCSGCHAMEGVTQNSVPAGLPSLRGIANRDGQTGQRIFDTLINPHPPMPDASLSIGEIQSIILYLETLRTNPNVPPLIVPRDQLKLPVYPRQS